MMIFNCSLSAAKHLYPGYKKNENEGFFEPSTECLIHQKNTAMQWLVHAIKIEGEISLIAMEQMSRCGYVIHQAQKGDVQGFVERLNQRLVNHIGWMGTDFSLFTEAQMDKSIATYFKQNQGIRFWQQTDASVMAHLNQISSEYQDVWFNVGDYPEDEAMALAFELRVNDTWRCKKGEKYGLKADEKLLSFWLQQFMGHKPEKANTMIKSMSKARHALFMEGAGAFREEREQMLQQLQTHADTSPAQVIDLASFRKQKNKPL